MDTIPDSAVYQLLRAQGAVRSGTMCVEVNQGNLYTAPRMVRRPPELRRMDELSTIVDMIASVAERYRINP